MTLIRREQIRAALGGHTPDELNDDELAKAYAKAQLETLDRMNTDPDFCARWVEAFRKAWDMTA